MDLPKKDPRDRGVDSKKKQRSISLPLWMWKRVDEIAHSHGYKPNAALREIVRWWIDNAPAKPDTKAK